MAFEAEPVNIPISKLSEAELEESLDGSTETEPESFTMFRLLP